MVERIYFVSGLGADKRVFRKLKFPSRFELVYIDWIVPHENELLEAYALRLAAVIDSSMPFYLIGVSFGGFIATEIAKSFKPVHTFIISSLVTAKEMPWYYKLVGSLRLLDLIPVNLLKSANKVAYQLFGAKLPEHKIMLKHIMLDTDASFLKWALKSSLSWRNTVVPENLTHIHGTADRILPIKYTHPHQVINKGGHLMVYVNANLVSEMMMRRAFKNLN